MAIEVGRPARLKVCLAGGEVIDRALLVDADSTRLSPGIVETVRQRSDGVTDVDVAVVEPRSVGLLLAELQASGGGPATPSSALVDWEPDVIVLSIGPDISSDGDVDAFRSQGLELISVIKERVGAHLVFVNSSSIAPGTTPGSWDNETSERIHRLNRIVIEFSEREGVSIVDVDRLAAEMGAGTHVLRTDYYSDALEQAIGAELIRILDDYGYFEERPLVAQVGRRPS